jgi:hypothetical protein
MFKSGYNIPFVHLNWHEGFETRTWPESVLILSQRTKTSSTANQKLIFSLSINLFLCSSIGGQAIPQPVTANN